MTMLSQLSDYHLQAGIAVAEAAAFRCRHYASCKGDSPDFTTAKAAYVGAEYENPSNPFPRLLFLSLDPYKPHDSALKRSLEGVRKIEVKRDDLAHHPHWLQTHQMAQTLLNAVNPDFFKTPRDVYAHFANVNSAKCCQNLTRMSASRLFDNCREFIPEEIRILNPHIIVTQGKKAKDVLVKEMKAKITVSDPNATRVKFEWGTVPLRDSQFALWFPTYHPTWFRRYRRAGETHDMHWNRYADLVRQSFLEKRDLDSSTGSICFHDRS